MSRLICLCNGVREDKIIESIKASEHVTLQLIQENTGAATNCGRCINAIECLIEKHQETLITDNK